jgi:putative ABC transport system permease protein
MFFALLWRALWIRKWRTLAAVSVIILGVGVMLGMLNVYSSMDQKMGKEMQAYGANLLISPINKNQRISMNDIQKIDQELQSSKTVGMAPFQYGAVLMKNKSLVLVGTWLDQMKKISPYWKVDGTWIQNRDNTQEAMVGEAVAQVYGIELGSSITITANENQKPVSLKVVGIITSGGTEDNQVFVTKQLAQKILKRNNADIIMASVTADKDTLQKVANQLQTNISTITAQPIQQIVQVETLLLNKLQKLIFLVAVIILVLTILTVMATMISMILERKKEIGLKKALGASDGKLIAEFVAEAGVIGVLGNSLGILLAYYLAQAIGQSVFHSGIAFHMKFVPWSYLGSLVVISIGFLLTMKRITDVEPMVILKSE